LQVVLSITIDKWADSVPDWIIVALWLLLLLPLGYWVCTSKTGLRLRASIREQIHSKPVHSIIIGLATGVVIAIASGTVGYLRWNKDSQKSADGTKIARESQPPPKAELIPSPPSTRPVIAKQEPSKGPGDTEKTRKPSAPLEEPAKALAILPEGSQPAINAPYGIAIGRDNTGTAIVNNYALAPRRLTTAQISALETVAESLPDGAGQYVLMKIVNDPETVRYASEISQIFRRHNKLKNVLTALSWSGGPPPEGVFVLVQDANDDNFPTAQKIANAMVASGIQLNFTRAEWAKKGEVWILIGTRPER